MEKSDGRDPMRIDIVTLFPDMFAGPFDHSIVKRALDRKLVSINIHNLRDYGLGKHKTVDDYSFGGGSGMLMRPEPFFEAVAAIQAQGERPIDVVILLSPQGRLFSQKTAAEIAARGRIVLLCGHYEGVDERVSEYLATDEISIGDYVLTGGELPAMVVVDGVVRLLPGVLGSDEATISDSHADGLLEYPQYTRPQEYLGHAVPEVLLSGNHRNIAAWRRERAILRTKARRPDLLAKADLSHAEKRLASDKEMAALS